jgi:hypothetical protein
MQGKKGNVTFVFNFMTSLVKVTLKNLFVCKRSCKMIILLENLGVRHVCLMFLEIKLMVKDIYCRFDDDDDGEVHVWIVREEC